MTIQDDMIAYWIEYDQLETEEERIALQSAFLIAHGGRWITPRPSLGGEPNGPRVLAGGVFPVRQPE